MYESDEKKLDIRLHEYRINELADSMQELKQEIRNLVIKFDDKFDALTSLIMQDRALKQDAKLQRSGNVMNIISAVIGGVMGFIVSLVLAIFNIV